MEGQVFIESNPPPLPDPGGPGGTAGAAASPTSARDHALRKVRGPAIALVAVGVLVLGSALLNVALHIGGPTDPGMVAQNLREVDEALRKGGVDREVREAAQHFLEWLMNGNRGLSIAMGLLNAAVGAFIVFSGFQLLSLRGRTLALFAAVISMLPCLTPCLMECPCCPCCFIGIPVGVWVIMTLQRSDVFDQFR